MIDSFSVIHRNPGHWDIYTSEEGRLFAIRGGPGKYYIRDEREMKNSNGNKEFKTVESCFNYIINELTFELIIAEGQTPTIIKSWNV